MDWAVFGLGMLAGSVLAAIYAFTQEHRLEHENRRLLRMLQEAYAELAELERQKYED